MSAEGGPAADAEIGFEELYARAGDHLVSVPSPAVAAHPALIAWLDAGPPLVGTASLVIGCGMGDDAEALASRGCAVTAFDVASTAIARCRKRLRIPEWTSGWRTGFGLPAVGRTRSSWWWMEIRRLQSRPVSRRAAAVAAMPPRCVRVAGCSSDAWLMTRTSRWVRAVTRDELRGFVDAGLTDLELCENPPACGRARAFTVVYERA